MLLASSVLVLTLLQQIEEASHAAPLLGTSALLPAETYPGARGALIDNAHRAWSRGTFQTLAAHLLLIQAPTEATRLCREIPGRASIACWSLVDAPEHSEAETKFPLDASEILATADAARAGKLPKRMAASRAITKKMDRADEDDVANAERSRLFREVFDESGSIEDGPERLAHRTAITAWFAGNREESTAALAAFKLRKTFAARALIVKLKESLK